MKNPTPEELQRMAEARHAALIRKWIGGKKLIAEEKAEISHLLPQDLLDKGPTSPGAKEAVKGALSTRKHAKYARKLPEYAPLYDSTDRAIKRWIRRGKELSDLPPLDNPTAMAAWWRRCMDHVVPDKLLAFAPAEKNAPASSPDVPGHISGPRDFSGIESLDIADNVAALRRTHAINQHLLDEALHADPPNEQNVTLRQRNYERSFELLRKAESTLIDLQKQRGKLVDEEAVRNELAQLFEALRLMRETMPRRIMAELERLLPRRLQRIFRIIDKSLTPAIEKTRADEENIFRNLQSLTNPDSIRKALPAN